MEENKSHELFFTNSLKGSIFYFYCPNMVNDDKMTITNLIKENKGVRIYNILFHF